MKEVHISSLLIQHHPLDLPYIEEYEDEHPDLELYIDPKNKGKTLALLEVGSLADIKSHINAIGMLEGVINVAMIYHQVEDADSLDEVQE